MEAKKYITHQVTKRPSGAGIYSEEYSSVLTSRYVKVIVLFALMLISYKICIATDVGYIKSINETANNVLADTVISNADSNKTDSDECYAPVEPNASKSIDSSYAVTLNLLADQNEAIANNMVNSYFDGIDDADSMYRVSKSIKSGTFLATITASPLITVFPLAIASMISPSMKNLHIDPSKLNNAAYVKGYKYQAHYIKKRKLWGCFVEGGTPWCILMGFLIL
jgi:hypothetical protein